MSILKGRKIDFYLSAFAALISVVLGVLILIMGGSATAATVTIHIPLLLFFGAGLFGVSIWVDCDFLTLLETLIYILAFAFTISYSINVVVDQINAIQYSGGKFSSVLVYLILSCVAIGFSIVACFTKERVK